MLEPKGNPNVSKSCPNKETAVLTYNDTFLNSPKSHQSLLGYFRKQIFYNELLKIAQSVHTAAYLKWTIFIRSSDPWFDPHVTRF